MRLGKSIGVDKEWQAQDDSRTLGMAEKIKRDPGRMEAAKKYVMREMESMKLISKMNPKMDKIKPVKPKSIKKK